MSLWVDQIRYDVAIDLSNYLPINRVNFQLSGLDAGTQGKFCMDELAFDESRIGPLVKVATQMTPNYTTTVISNTNVNNSRQTIYLPSLFKLSKP